MPGHLSLHATSKRPRGEEERERRRALILEAARGLLEGAEYTDVTVAKLADAAELGKATLYGYFETREELLLCLYEEELVHLADRVCAGLIEAADVERVTEVMVAALTESTVYRRLVAVVHTHLWPKVTPRRALQSRDLFAEQITRAGAVLEGRLGLTPAGAGSRICLRFHAYGLGMLSVANANAGPHESFALFDFDFERDMSTLLRTLLVQHQADA